MKKVSLFGSEEAIHSITGVRGSLDMTTRLVPDPQEAEKTPPSSPVLKDGEVFKSPSSSISAESGIDLKYFSIRSVVARPRPKMVVEQDEEEPKVVEGHDASVDSIFTESYINSVTSSTRPEVSRTPWEAVYAFRHSRKLVKPTFQGRVYNFLERPKEWNSVFYHSFMYAAILGTLLLSVLTTVAENKLVLSEALYFVEVILVVFLSTEYAARVWSAGCRSKYLGLYGRLRFVTKPICIIDFIIISSSITVIVIGSDGQIFDDTAIKGVRFLQILRMLHMDREGGCWRLLGSVVAEHKKEMFTALYIGFLGLVFSSYFMFLIEKDAIVNNMPSTAFETYADALWWGVVTMMTIGYGDKVPLTWSGRLLACASAMFTVSFFALPAGILGSGFALKVQQQQRQKHFSRQIPAAANLIQSLWRCFAADKSFNSVATWKIHVKTSTSNSTNKYNKSIAALKRRRPKYKADFIKNEQNGRKTYGEISVNLDAPKTVLHQSRSVPDMMISIHDDLMKNEEPPNKLQSLFTPAEEYRNDTVFYENENNEGVTIVQLSEAHKNAIRVIRKIKYFVAKRKFQQARKPYDVGDVIEQYSQGQLSMNVRLKELHRRLDQMLGKSGSELVSRTGKPVSLCEKLQQMDTQMQQLEQKIDNISYAVHTIASELQKSRSDRAPTTSS